MRETGPYLIIGNFRGSNVSKKLSKYFVTVADVIKLFLKKILIFSKMDENEVILFQPQISILSSVTRWLNYLFNIAPIGNNNENLPNILKMCPIRLKIQPNTK